LNKVLRLLVLLPAILFMVMGVRWLVAPAGIAPDLGLTLAEGVGRSSQIGDMSGYFLTLGTCMLIALISERRNWFYPPMMLLGVTALGRIVAWLLHDATLTVGPIIVEIIVALILLLASRRLPQES
jgi:hypothetical protein